ncbi:hypothetical protein SAY86_005249 [Trapa natans]|uniref:C2 domain-containing protein n=1 Tax=Trapa natans TaxID=22666 RepID=A0AAN7L0F8_TRANT|nr:hypothetical protein SAY86_005249 [Trapa natans]
MATVQKLVVEVVEAVDLLPKDGHGTSSPYVVFHYKGQRRRTQTAIRDLNPKWGEMMKFNVGKPSEIFSDVLEVSIYHDKNVGPTRRNNFLGRISIGSSQFVKKGEEALIYYPLQKKDFLSWVRGEIGLKIYYADEEVPQPQPQPQPAPPQENAPPPSGEALPPDATPTSEAAAVPPPPQENVPLPEGESPPLEAPSPQTENSLPNGEATAEPAEADATSDGIPQPHPPEVMAAAASSASIPVVKFAGISAPPPLPRPLPLNRTYTTDSPDSTTILERSSFDLVDKMHYLFVKVVKARHLPTNGSPVVKIVVSSHHLKSRPSRKSSVSSFFEWDQTFAFGGDAPESSSILEVSVWDPPGDLVGPSPDVAGYKFFGGICFHVMEIPLRDPPDSPLAPQWYRLEGGGAHHGDLMLATWIGTQADEAFPEAWKSDTAGNVNARAKVYQSPKLWYLRATVIEAQDIMPSSGLKEQSFQVKVQLGFQLQKTKVSVTRDGTLAWNEDLLFVAAEPFDDSLLTFAVESRQSRGPATLGMASVPLVAIERRVEDRKVASRWITLESPLGDKKRVYKGRVHLRLCFDGGYHVMDEPAHVCSDFRPTARQLWKPPVGSVELGIIGCRNLLPMKMANGRGTTDAFCVAKYGPKWVRTRTVCDTLEPKWNEQYTWRVYDPCTVLTIGVFHNSGEAEDSPPKDTGGRPDFRIGKVRVRISTLQTNRVYRNIYPLLMLSAGGMKKMGEVEIAIRFVQSSPTLDFLHVYSQPLLPSMHHVKPLGPVQGMLRRAAAKTVAAHLSRSEPPIRAEVVLYMLDADSEGFSMRKVRANWLRIINVIVGMTDIVWWVDDIRRWKKPTATILVQVMLMVLVWFPDIIIPTLAFYLFAIGAWKYRFRSRDPLSHFCPRISLAESADGEELDEEFDGIPSARPPDVVQARYDKMRSLGVRLQTVLGDMAAQGERVQALVTWRDPRATGIFIWLCFVVALILYIMPMKVVAVASGFYYFRHPIFRDRMPSSALNFFRRLPSLADRMM